MITAFLSTRKNSALHHSQTLVKLRGCLCSLLCPEQYYMEVKTYKDNPVTEKVVLNKTVVSTNVSLCVLHIVQPFWQCSVGFLVLNNPLQESASVTSTRPMAPGRDPTCALPTPFSSGAPAVSACLNIKLADGLRRNLICHAPALTRQCCCFSSPSPDCDGVRHLSHTGLPSASRSLYSSVSHGN